MKITTCTYSGPDSDGEMSFNVSASLENSTDHDIELIKTSCLILDQGGIIAGGSFDDEVDVYIDPGETDSIDISTPWNIKINGDLDKIKVISDTLLYRREFYKLGMVDVPKDHKATTKLDKKVDVGGAVKIYGAVVMRDKPDDDGEVTLQAKVGVRNLTSDYIERVSVKMVVLDQEDAQLDEDSSYQSLAPNSSTMIEPSCWSIKKNRLRNCQVRLSLSVYLPIDSKNAEAIAKEE
jgi:hypothetical protein